MRPIRLALLMVVLTFLGACETIPPNTVELRFESVPSAAAVFSPEGEMLGVTPFALMYRLQAKHTSANHVRFGVGSAVWKSGAKATLNLDFGLNGGTFGTFTYKFRRPIDAPGVSTDVAHAEARERTASAGSQEGWAALAGIVNEHNRQKAAIARNLDPFLLPKVGGAAVECVSTSVWPNRVETKCK